MSDREVRIHALGREIYQEVAQDKPGVFQLDFYSGKLIDWAMEDEAFKISLFRFVDVFPVLGRSSAIVRHAQEYFEDSAHRIPAFLRWGMNVDPSSLSAKFASPIIARQIKSMAQRFIVGDSPRSALKRLREIRKSGMSFTVDLLGEAAVGESESADYLARYIDLLETLTSEVPKWRESVPLVEGHRGERSPVNVSVKLSALYSQARPLSTNRSIDILSERLYEILRRARSTGASVFIDMEDTALVSITLETVKRVLAMSELRDYDRCGFVLQAYLRRTEDDLNQLITWVKSRGVGVGVRLVKGAYWDTETILAQQKGWPIPVWTSKSSTDANYEKLSQILLRNHSLIFPAFASHNIRSLCAAVAIAQDEGVPRTEYELQALYGMAEPVKEAFRRRGFLIREYAPIGELLPGMSYLVRRLLENTSNEGFLRQTFREHETAEYLLRTPAFDESESNRQPPAHEQSTRDPRVVFSNIAPTDFSEGSERARFSAIFERFREERAASSIIVQPLVDGKALSSSNVLRTSSPNDRALRIADVHLADRTQTEEALASVYRSFSDWRTTTVSERAEILFRAADLMASEIIPLSALISMECGKPWGEAEADVGEAIDFLRYYAHEAERLFSGKPIPSLPGESNSYFYEPRGVAVVIGPWNFPLAIPCGMLSAALVCGNTAILKPAEQSSAIAQRLVQILIQAGVPANCVAFLPGVGEEIGPQLVTDSRVSTVLFTGSKAVGLSILNAAASPAPGSEHITRVVAEMGGKNAIIVDDDADLDEAIRGVVASAFGYAGQKCSACSRLIVLESIYDRFCERLADATSSLVLGPSWDPSVTVGPLIDEMAYNRTLEVIAKAKTTCKVLVDRCTVFGELPKGYFVPPIVFRDVPTSHQLFREEFFAPVLAALPAKDFDHALELANDSIYALTGAVFSRSPVHIERAIREFRVGNLYINRGSTGALVERQPFGGARMSGVGSKAGGPDYLLQFVYPRSVSENTMRRGFAPET